MILHSFPLSPQGALESHDPSAPTYTRQLKLQDAIVPHDPLPLICAQQLNPQGALVPHDPPPTTYTHTRQLGTSWWPWLEAESCSFPSPQVGVVRFVFSPFCVPLLSSFFLFRFFSLIPPPTYTRHLKMHGVPVSHDPPHTLIPGS